MRLSIRARLTLWFSVLITAALSVFGAGVLGLHGLWGRAQFDSELTISGAAISRMMQEEISESGALEHAVADTRGSLDVSGRAAAILDATGRPLAAEWHGFRYSVEARNAPIRNSSSFATVTDVDGAWRVFVRHESSTAGDYSILVAGRLDEVAAQQRLLARILLAATPLIVLLAAAACWWVASSALRPVTLMAAQSEAITIDALDRRLEAPTATDELGQLARAFNELLNRLGTALRMQRQFMADASHEIRTPVSVIQTAAEVTLERQTRQPWEYREALTIVKEQSARLSRIVADMLTLARADAGGYRLRMQLLDVDDVVAECLRAATVLGRPRNVQFVANLQPEVSLRADDELLRQLVGNLLDNAVHHTPAGGRVTVSLSADDSEVTLTVSDTGSGIAAADRARVFERFVRLDPARSSTSGAGLGLSIARWIAEQHAGALTLEEPPGGGCRFVARLPKRPRPVNDASRERGNAA